MQYRITIPDNIKSCVYKLNYLDKYFVVKCKNLQVSIDKLQNGLNCFIKGTENGRDPENLAYDFFNYILWNPNGVVLIELLFESKNPYRLLKYEQCVLWESENDKNCLNKKFNAYIPVFTQVNGKGSWINKGYYLNFMRWKKKALNQSTIV